MIAQIEYKNKLFKVDLSRPLDISLVIQANENNPIAWYLNAPEIKPVVMGEWVGEVAKGTSSTNFFNIFFNPHAHGTHTECLGHITQKRYSILDSLQTYFFYSKLISVIPKKIDNDWVITKNQIENLIATNEQVEALIIRTLPNSNHKKNKKYSHTNPPYLSEDAAKYIREIGINHLLIDLPSVDKEKDNGALLAHKAFWNVLNIENVNTDAKFNATITEMVYVDDKVADDYYLLNLQIASFLNDATPSKPILYQIL